MEEYNVGDLVAVFGGNLDRKYHKADSASFCKVLIVGQDDLVVENTSYYSTSYHVVPKSICVIMYLDPQILSSAETVVPKIGDLVVSYSRAASGTGVDEKNGILCKIMYKMGRPTTCELLCGTENITVGWDSLIVIRRD